MTDAELIAQYIKLRDFVQAQEKVLEETLKPYKVGMETIANAMLARLNEQDTQSVKTTSGTAYISTVVSAKVIDRDAFINYVMLHKAYGLLTSNVAKDAVKDFIEENGANPPGVETTQLAKCLFRRA